MAESKIQPNRNYLVKRQVCINYGDTYGVNYAFNIEGVSGYHPIGIVGYHEDSSEKVYYYNMRYVDSTNKLEIGWETRDHTVLTNHQCWVYILFERD